MKCPTCRAKVSKDPTRPNKLFPFCSERCHLVDLGRWLSEDYRVPGPSWASDSSEAPPSSDDD
jgi:endogenous inhibitor of DNA gyrase (YacG/DUF329 family)